MERAQGKSYGEIPHRVLQQFLEAVAETPDRGITREERILLSFAEVQFQIRGGSQCAVCHAAVRLVIPVHSNRMDGSTAEFACLCTRCLTAERAVANRVVLSGGKISIEYGSYGTFRKSTQKFRFGLKR